MSAQAERIKWKTGIVVWLIALGFLMPFVWMLLSSLKRDIDIFGGGSWWPDPLQWANYRKVWTGQHSLLHYFANSILVAVPRVLGELMTASMAGYAFARLRFRGRDGIFLLYLATSIVPVQLLLVPRFMFFSELGLYDTLLALILPGMFTVLGTFLMRQYFSGLPGELAEAARLDGAGEWRVFWSVYLPLARPVLASLGILGFVWSWNDYEGPLIMLSSDSKYTIPLGLTQFVSENGALSAGLAMAASVCATVPIVIIFLAFQRNFLAALSTTGLK
ncbi:carbohydrate ABC transporter permease [Kribbella sp. NBC_00482]|uniref:carbohydrate ABC transporter permease n=1 Tax=Kribbella sp. NBC_00482 TaxID=2975968 RepID=UPI002E17D6FA